MTVCKVFSETVKRHPNKTCLIFEDSEWTFQDLEDFANKVANYFLSIGFKVTHIWNYILNGCREFFDGGIILSEDTD